MCLHVPEIYSPYPYLSALDDTAGFIQDQHHDQQDQQQSTILYTWSDARSLCRSYSGDLTVIPTMKDLSEVLRSLRDAGDGGFWLGGKASSNPLFLPPEVSEADWFSNTREYTKRLKWVTGEYSKVITEEDIRYATKVVREFSEPSLIFSADSPELFYDRMTLTGDNGVPYGTVTDHNGVPYGTVTDHNGVPYGTVTDHNGVLYGTVTDHNGVPYSTSTTTDDVPECLLLLKKGHFRLVLENCDAQHRPLCQHLPALVP